MALVSDNLRRNGIKIVATVCGLESYGSGVLYQTPPDYDFNYVLTAKHILQEDSSTPYEPKKVGLIELHCCQEIDFCMMEVIGEKDINRLVTVFEDDFAIIKVRKNDDMIFRDIIVSDTLTAKDQDFFSWGIFGANTEVLQKFDYQRNDVLAKRYKLTGNLKYDYLPGMSGSGIFANSRSVLLGIVISYPNEEFQNETVDCCRLSFEKINHQLRQYGLPELDTTSSAYKKEINKNIVNIRRAIINKTSLDLSLARKRLMADLTDDWFHDPLKYIDLLRYEFIFEQLAAYLNEKTYKADFAERFFVPKKQLTLRSALLSPFTDRLIYMAVVGVLAPKLDEAMISSVYSARFSMFSENSLILNGVEQWKKMQYQLDETAHELIEAGRYRYDCVIEIDLLNFYDNINKRLLIEKIMRVCETENERMAAEFMKRLLFEFSEKDSGLPQNSDASALLASFYLNQVDVFMQHHAPSYFRFMDDIKIFCHDRFQARRILQTFELELRRCYLSVNSQKTRIVSIISSDPNQLPDNTPPKLGSNEKFRNSFGFNFDLETAKISKYKKSYNHQYRNEAFHAACKMLKENLSSIESDNEEAGKKINFSLNTMALLLGNQSGLSGTPPDLLETIIHATQELKERPWITAEVCKVLSLMPKEIIEVALLSTLKEIVVLDNYNAYAAQVYQLWLLLAKHKCDDKDLKNYAAKQIEKNDDTERPVTAGMIVYLCSVDPDYRRVLLRKFREGFTRGYFQNRITLIALRAFATERLGKKFLAEKIDKSHKYTHMNKDRDLVFVAGFDEETDDLTDAEEQLYSLV